MTGISNFSPSSAVFCSEARADGTSGPSPLASGPFDSSHASKSHIRTVCFTSGCLTTTVMGVWPCPRVVRRGMCRAPRGGRLFATSAHETRQSKPAPSAETCTGTANPLGIFVRNAALQRSTQNLDSADQLCCTSKLRLREPAANSPQNRQRENCQLLRTPGSLQSAPGWWSELDLNLRAPSSWPEWILVLTHEAMN